ncbi:predicted protein [Lichtheimia corymbifera JMRC:FSU:9682]|uniref:Uncharacterized protein n=1 Tax=Lichtheimia corymbifera JMRC:FSU:9682 TaxID=1263082 RepID=A0A068SAN9_9FUNG|nr:predicted protein [Lichtheimia corymbifera JMRC:FSU:9682]
MHLSSLASNNGYFLIQRRIGSLFLMMLSSAKVRSRQLHRRWDSRVIMDLHDYIQRRLRNSYKVLSGSTERIFDHVYDLGDSNGLPPRDMRSNAS